MIVGEDQIEQVLDAIDLIALVGQDLRLQPRGKEFVGLCPFHDDKKPSLFVSPGKQIYKCFSCNAGGNAYQWMMNYHKMRFPEALRFLAERAGIRLRAAQSGRTSSASADQPTDRQVLGDTNAKAIRFFQSLLQHREHGKVARAYVQARGIDEKMTEAFQIGYAADKWDGLVQMITRHRWPAQAFRQAGLISQRSSGGSDYDRLRHRLIFPICDGLGRPVAFGGRTLPEGTLDDPNEAKYLNSPETALFSKSSTLYGLHLAKQRIMELRCVVVVEGYVDVIACHQAGFANVVATLGTALTAQHVRVLRRFADRVVLVFDGDQAGQKAAERAVQILLSGELDVGVVIGPKDLDPADILSSPDGPMQWQQMLEEARDALDYQFERMRGDLDATSTMAGRQQVAESYIRQLAQMGLARQGLLRRAMIVQKLADLLHLTERQVTGLIRQFAPAKATGTASRPTSGATINKHGAASDHSLVAVQDQSQTGEPPSPEREQSGEFIGLQSKKKGDVSIALDQSGHKMKALQMAERQLIGSLLLRPSLFHQAILDGQTLDKAVTPSEMLSSSAKRLYQLIHHKLSDGNDLTTAGVLADLALREEQELSNLATEAQTEVERMTEDDDQKLHEVVSAASRSLVRFHEQQRYEQSRAEELSGVDQTNQTNEERILRRAVEHQRANPSGARIARLSR